MQTIYDLPKDTGKLLAVKLAPGRYASCRKDKIVKVPGETAYIEEHKYEADRGVGEVLVDAPSVTVPALPLAPAPEDFEAQIREMLGLPADTPQGTILDLIRAANNSAPGSPSETPDAPPLDNGDLAKTATAKATATTKPAK